MSIKDKGFTLLELLIAIAISSIILVVIYQTFFLSEKAISKYDEKTVKLEEARKLLDIMRREVEASFYNKDDNNTLFCVEDRDIFGISVSKFTFTTFSPIKSGLLKISYFVKEEDKKLVLFKRVNSAFEKNRKEADMIEGINSFRVEVKYKDKWVKVWDSKLAHSLPEEIKIILTIPVGNKKLPLSMVACPMIGRSI